MIFWSRFGYNEIKLRFKEIFEVKPIKIDDIARLAGVSIGTVSKVINGYHGVALETRNKVNQIIQEYGFEPNVHARNLAGKKDKVIGIFVLDPWGLHGAFYQVLIALIIDAAEKRDLRTVVSTIKTNKQKSKIKRMIDLGTISGAIVIGCLSDEPELEEYLAKGYKIVAFDYSNAHPSPNIVLVNSNNYDGARLATKYLKDLGLTKIYHFAGDQRKFAGTERKRGFCDELEGSDIEYKVFEGDFLRWKGDQLFKELVANNDVPQAIFCANDEMAIGCLHAMYALGMDFGQVRIIGYDDTEMSGMYRPSLSTVSYNLQGMARCAVRGMEDLIKVSEVTSAASATPAPERQVYNGKLKLHIRDT